MHPAGPYGSDGNASPGRCRTLTLAPLGRAVGRAVDRRTLLVGAAGALAAAGLSGPARAAGHADVGGGPVRPALRPGPRASAPAGAARRAARSEHARPGAILHVRSPRLGRWTGVAGLGRVAPDVPMRRARSVPGREHREAVRLGRGAATRRARPAVARRPAARGAARGRRRPLPDRGRHHGAHAARPPQRDPGMGQPRHRRAGRASSREGVDGLGVPRSRGRASRRCSRPERASPTPTRTTTCSA